MVFETRMDREGSRGIGMRLLAPRQNNCNLIFFGSPVTADLPWPRLLLEIQPWEEHCSEMLLLPRPFYRHLLITNYYTHTHI